MKRFISFLVGTALTAAVVTLSVLSRQSKDQVHDDIMLENIEALASGEHTYFDCFDYGSLTCPLTYIKVWMVYSTDGIDPTESY